MPPKPEPVIIRRPDELPELGAFIRAWRRYAGMADAREIAPYLGVGTRLLVQLESGTRGKHGVTTGKLLGILAGLGLELVVRPRSGPAKPPRRKRLSRAARPKTSGPHRLAIP